VPAANLGAVIRAATLRYRVVAALAALVAVVPGCAAASPPSTPQRLTPWPQRPVLELTFDMAPDLHTATGSESVLFTPDQQVCQLVFRDWPNKPTTARTGSSLTVTTATIDGTAVTPTVQTGGAPDGAPGTLLELPLPACVPAGTAIRAQLAFQLTLGADAGERVGYSATDATAWFGTAFPLLAWQRGQGWIRDPAVDMYGETVTSEEFQLAALTVTAATDQTVTATGSAVGTSTPTPGRTAHRFTADSVRDVAVSVGHYDLTEQQIGNVHVHVATPHSGTRVTGTDWAKQIGQEIGALQTLLGPYPYADIWATIVPTQNDGVEFPQALQLANTRRRDTPALLAHELAHQWFYSLVGNNQARDPWLDESLATLAQAIAASQQDQYQLADIPDRYIGQMGNPMQFWADNGGFDQYVRGVYDQGAATLLAARNQVGADTFDPALRAYINANAHRIATPNDVAAAFHDLPQVLDLLRVHGAGTPR
jgi:hypothetical protein